MQNQPTIMIIGASGKTGRRVAERLAQNDIAYRSASTKSDIPFDWYDEATWPRPLEDIRTVYATFYPDIAVPGASQIIERFIARARQIGVEHMILLTGRGEHEAQVSEQLLIDSGLDWTIVRCSWFMQNFSESFFLDDILKGEIVLPVGADIVEPFVDTEDIAEVVFRAIMRPQPHKNQLYELTGPELLSFADVANKFSNLIGRHVTYTQVTPEAYGQAVRASNLPTQIIDLMNYLYSEVLDGRNAHLADGIRQSLDREPTSFNDYIKRTMPTNIWNA